ncbi:MAG: cupin domain-containing protein [Candidatus Dormiibacterota bacterium]
MELGRALLYRAGEGERLEARGSVMLFKAVASATHGRLSVMERTLPPGGRMPPPHAHAASDEAYFVLDGVVTFLVDGERVTGEADCFVLVPGGVIHTFGNHSSQLARLLIIHSPGLDPYFRDLSELWSGPEPPAPEAERELMQRHGMELA